MTAHLARLLLAALLAAPAFPAAADWVRAESPHFRVITNGSEPRARQYLEALERFHHVMLVVLGADPTKASQRPPFDVYLLRDSGGLNKVRPHFGEKFSGVHVQCRDGAQAYAKLFRRIDIGRQDSTLVVLFHEYAHRLMAQYGALAFPAWYVEGFAEYFGQAQIEGDEVLIGDAASWNAGHLRRGSWLDFEAVLKPQFKFTGDKDGPTDAHQNAFYAQSWLLTHYMLSDSERTRRFNAYFQRLAAGEDPLDAFKPATGIEVRQLPGLLRDHGEHLQAGYIQTRNMARFDAAVTVLPQAQGDVLFDASILKTCPPVEQGQEILARLRAREAAGDKSRQLQLALARAEVGFDSAKTAIGRLQPLLAADDTDAEAQHLMGRALAKQASAEPGDAGLELRATARTHLFKAYRLKKNDAANLYQLARLLRADGPGPSLENTAQGAHVLEPSIGEYAMLAAIVDLDAGKRERAVRALDRLAYNPHGMEFAARVRVAIAAIRDGKDAATVVRILRNEPNARP